MQPKGNIQDKIVAEFNISKGCRKSLLTTESLLDPHPQAIS